MGLVAVLIAGLSFLVGCIIALFIKRKDNIISFSVSMSFAVLVILLIFEMLPESLELLEGSPSIIIIIIGVIVGFSLLKLIDRFIPHHGEQHGDHNLIHIGAVTAIALIIHGIIDGVFIYGYTMLDTRMGFIYAIAAALYHIPLGINLALLLKDNPKKMWICILILTASPLLGGLLVYSFGRELNEVFLGIMLTIAMGMIIYIMVAELWIKIKNNLGKYTLFGIITGSVLVILGMVI